MIKEWPKDNGFKQVSISKEGKTSDERKRYQTSQSLSGCICFANKKRGIEYSQAHFQKFLINFFLSPLISTLSCEIIFEACFTLPMFEQSLNSKDNARISSNVKSGFHSEISSLSKFL